MRATKCVLNLGEMRALLWLLCATDCGAIISGSEEHEADLANLRKVHGRVSNRSIQALPTDATRVTVPGRRGFFGSSLRRGGTDDGA